MRMLKRMGGLWVLCLVTSSAWAGEPGRVAPESLVDAHQAYVDGDISRMVRRLREVLEEQPEDVHIRDNALALLEKAYERNAGAVPTDWKLPPAIINMRLSQALRPDGTFRTRISGNMAHANAITQLRLGLPGQRPLLDKRAGVGDWMEKPEQGSGYEYELEVEDQRDAMADGLYLLRMETADGRIVDGYVILSNLAASTSPIIRSPMSGETLAAKDLALAWDDHVTPERKFFERRALWVGVARCNPPDFTWDEVWGEYVDHPGPRSAAERKPPRLPEGRYMFHVSFKESRTFGEVRLRRESNNTVTFHVTGSSAP